MASLQGTTVNGQLNVNHSTPTSVLRLYSGGSTVWSLGVGDASGTNFNITADFGSILINKSTGAISGLGPVTATSFSGSGASLTSLTAGNLTGTIPSAVLGNSTVYIGTTGIALNRASASQSLTGVNIDGSSASCTGNAATATTLQTPRNIGGVSFNGSADINLPGVNIAGNQSTSGNAATASNVTLTNLNTQQVSVALTAGSWYTIAANFGDRASAKFTITDSTSGLHQAVHFYASAHFGTASGAKITVVSNTYYSGPPFGKIRIMTGGTYDGAMVQVYINYNCTINVSIYDNQQVGGWIIKSGVVSTTNPGTVAAFASLTINSAEVDLNSGKSFSVTDDIYIGVGTTQYKVLHANNYTDYTVTKIGAGASGSWGINITGSSASCTGNAANVTGTVAVANGGSGQTSAQAAMNTFAGAVTSGNYLRGNGTNVVMSAIQAADVPTLNQSTTGNAATASLATTSDRLTTRDNRTISPSEDDAYRLRYGFTSWANNDTSPYADYLHLRSYSDDTGGNDNLVMFRKDAIGMRIWQAGFGTTQAYSSFKDVAFTDQSFFIGTTSVAINRGSGTLTLNGVNVGGSSASCTGNAATATALTSMNISQFTNNSGYLTSAVTSAIAGTGISVNASTGAVTITNSSPNATHTGDVTGATALTIANNAVTYAKIQNVSVTSRVLGRITAGAGVIEELTGADIAQIIGANTITNATNATNATTVGGLAVQSGTNYEANKIVRTDVNGYILAGWINTISGDNSTTAIDRVYASHDGYIRYYTPTNFRTVLDVPTRAGSGASGNWAINVTGTAANVTGTVAVANGGTGATSFTAGRILFGNGTSAINTNANLFWDNTNSRLGIGTTTPAYPLDVNGACHATSFPTSSDLRFKTNIKNIPNALDKILRLNGVSYEWNDFINNRRPGYGLNVPVLGLIAQDLEKVIPEVVSKWHLSDDCKDARAVDYIRIIPVLIEAVKELEGKNKILEARILALENK